MSPKKTYIVPLVLRRPNKLSVMTKEWLGWQILKHDIIKLENDQSLRDIEDIIRTKINTLPGCFVTPGSMKIKVYYQVRHTGQAKVMSGRKYYVQITKCCCAALS